jgi:quinol monooxygenase YgiN
LTGRRLRRAPASEELDVIIVTGRIRTTSDTLEDAKALSLDHVNRSRLEPGCIEHGVSQDVEDPTVLVFFERWADRDALAVHFRVPAAVSFVEAVTELAAEPPELHIYETVDERE